MKELYIVHGWMTKASNWDKTLTELQRRGVRAHFLRVPGLTDGADRTYTMEDYVEWVAQELPAGAVALGHSNGGRILLNALAAGKLHLEKLILLDSAGIYYRSPSARLAKVLSKIFGWTKRVPGVRRFVHRLLGANDYARASQAMQRTLENMLESDRQLDLTKVKVPTAIIWGSDDQTTPLWQAEKIHEGIAGSTIEVVDGWRHAPYLSDPEELAAKIAEQL